MSTKGEVKTEIASLRRDLAKAKAKLPKAKTIDTNLHKVFAADDRLMGRTVRKKATKSADAVQNEIKSVEHRVKAATAKLAKATG